MEICSVVICVILLNNNQTDVDENIIYGKQFAVFSDRICALSVIIHVIIIIIFFLCFIDVFHFLTL